MVEDVSTAAGEVPLARGEPELVYHYTDATGLLGIVKDKVIWASDVWFMNDAHEALYGLDVVERVLESLDLPAGSSRAGVRRRALGWLRSIREQEDFWRSYIACLSFHGDDLSQWRAYGRQRGFSIGFDTAQLRSLCIQAPEFGKPTFRYVAYDDAQQANTVTITFNTVVNALPTTPTGDQMQGAAIDFVNAALILAPALKHSAFSGEREIRLHVYRLAATIDGLRFRSGAMGIVPYIEIDLKDPGTNEMTLIHEVIIGPQANGPESQRAVKQLLACHSLKDVEVRLSKIPLRAS